MHRTAASLAVLALIATPALARHARQHTATPHPAFDMQRALKLHTDLRSSLGVPALSWSEALTQDAQNWANQLAKSGSFDHAANNDDGENLWTGWGGTFSQDSYFKSWLGERTAFINGVFPNISRSGNWADAGHYSQLIWRDTKELGCAAAYVGNRTVIVCRYRPAGNVEGEKALP
ncbi:MAG: SCP-like extracellular [Alphaproteobacteria bacterium]|nr:SCP-like extracellular [Alphaproteobacteria bacterium]